VEINIGKYFQFKVQCDSNDGDLKSLYLPDLAVFGSSDAPTAPWTTTSPSDRHRSNSSSGFTESETNTSNGNKWQYMRTLVNLWFLSNLSNLSDLIATFSGLYLVDGHFSAIQDHVFSLPALASFSIPANTQSKYFSVRQMDVKHNVAQYSTI